MFDKLIQIFRKLFGKQNAQNPSPADADSQTFSRVSHPQKPEQDLHQKASDFPSRVQDIKDTSDEEFSSEVPISLTLPSVPEAVADEEPPAEHNLDFLTANKAWIAGRHLYEDDRLSRLTRESDPTSSEYQRELRKTKRRNEVSADKKFAFTDHHRDIQRSLQDKEKSESFLIEYDRNSFPSLDRFIDDLLADRAGHFLETKLNLQQSNPVPDEKTSSSETQNNESICECRGTDPASETSTESSFPAVVQSDSYSDESSETDEGLVENDVNNDGTEQHETSTQKRDSGSIIEEKDFLEEQGTYSVSDFDSHESPEDECNKQDVADLPIESPEITDEILVSDHEVPPVFLPVLYKENCLTFTVLAGSDSSDQPESDFDQAASDFSIRDKDQCGQSEKEISIHSDQTQTDKTEEVSPESESPSQPAEASAVDSEDISDSSDSSLFDSSEISESSPDQTRLNQTDLKPDASETSVDSSPETLTENEKSEFSSPTEETDIDEQLGETSQLNSSFPISESVWTESDFANIGEDEEDTDGFDDLFAGTEDLLPDTAPALTDAEIRTDEHYEVPDPEFTSRTDKTGSESLQTEEEKKSGPVGARIFDTNKILGWVKDEWAVPRPIQLDNSITLEEALPQIEERIKTKHLLGLELLGLMGNTNLINSVHEKAKISMNHLVNHPYYFTESGKTHLRSYLEKSNPAAIVLSMSLIALDSNYGSLSSNAEEKYKISASNRSTVLKAMKAISGYYGTKEDYAPEFYLRQCIITRKNRGAFASLMAKVYTEIFESELPEDLESVLDAIFTDYVHELQNDDEDVNFQLVYQTQSLKQVFLTPFWHPELIQYSMVFLRYIDALYWQKNLDSLPYPEEFRSFFEDWFQQKQTKITIEQFAKKRRRHSPKWLASYRLISTSSGQLRISIATKTFYLEKGKKPSDYKVVFYKNGEQITQISQMHVVTHLKARMLESVSVRLENPFEGISYTLFCQDKPIYSSHDRMFRKWIFFDADGEEINPQEHLGETVLAALPPEMHLPNFTEFSRTEHVVIGETILTEKLLLYLSAFSGTDETSLTDKLTKKSFSAEIEGATIQFANIQYGQNRFPIYSDLRGIAITSGGIQFPDILLEIDGKYRKFQTGLSTDDKGNYRNMIRLSDHLDSGFHQIRILHKKNRNVLDTFQIFLDRGAISSPFMVFNPKKELYSYSNYTDLNDEGIHILIDLKKPRLISESIEMDQFKDPLQINFPSPLPFYRIGELGEWTSVERDLQIDQIEYLTRIYLDGVYSEYIEVISNNCVLANIPVHKDDEGLCYFESSVLLDCIPSKSCSIQLLFRTFSNERNFINLVAFSSAKIVSSSILPDLTTASIKVQVEGPHPARIRVSAGTVELATFENVHGVKTIEVPDLPVKNFLHVSIEGYSEDLTSFCSTYNILDKNVSIQKIDTNGLRKHNVKDGQQSVSSNSLLYPIEHTTLWLPADAVLNNNGRYDGYLISYATSLRARRSYPVEITVAGYSEQQGISRLKFCSKNPDIKLVYSRKSNDLHSVSQISTCDDPDMIEIPYLTVNLTESSKQGRK